MQRVYQVFLAVFVLLVAINLYAIEWSIGVLHEDNTKYIFSIVAGIVGIMVVYVLNTWSKLPPRK